MGETLYMGDDDDLNVVWFGGAPGMFRPGPRWAEAVKAAEAATEVEAREARQ